MVQQLAKVTVHSTRIGLEAGLQLQTLFTSCQRLRLSLKSCDQMH